MAYNNNPPRAEYTASAAQVTFPFLFKIFTSADIKVYQTPFGQAPDDTADLLTLTADYTVTINGDAGGEITLTAGATSGDTLTLLRSLDIKRDIEYQSQGDLTATTLNLDQEYQTYLIADREAANERVIKLSENSQGVNATLPSPSSEQYIRWNAEGTALINDTTIPVNTQLAVDSATAASASASSASTSASTAQLKAWTAEAEALTALSYAEEAEDVPVNLVTSDGDGTFTYTPQAGVFSSKHHALKSDSTTRVAKTSDTGSAVLPSGTTAQRDGTPANGYMRYNSELGAFEGFKNSAWGTIGGGTEPFVIAYNDEDEQISFNSGASTVIRSDKILDYNISLLLNFNQIAGQAIYNDESENSHAITVVGAPILTTPKFGTNGVKFPTTTKLKIADDTSLRLDAEDWTIEFFHRRPQVALTSHDFFCSKGVSGNLNDAWYFALLIGGNISFLGKNNSVMLSYAYPFVADNLFYHHISLNRVGGELLLFVDGLLVKTVPYTGIFDGVGDLEIGGWNFTTSNAEGGNIDNFIINKGTALRTSNFQVPQKEVGGKYYDN